MDTADGPPGRPRLALVAADDAGSAANRRRELLASWAGHAAFVAVACAVTRRGLRYGGALERTLGREALVGGLLAELFGLAGVAPAGSAPGQRLAEVWPAVAARGRYELTLWERKVAAAYWRERLDLLAALEAERQDLGTARPPGPPWAAFVAVREATRAEIRRGVHHARDILVELDERWSGSGMLR